MPKIQAIKNIVFLPTPPSLKNVASSLSHEEED
jgi:hypothetical protein